MVGLPPARDASAPLVPAVLGGQGSTRDRPDATSAASQPACAGLPGLMGAGGRGSELAPWSLHWRWLWLGSRLEHTWPFSWPLCVAVWVSSRPLGTDCVCGFQNKNSQPMRQDLVLDVTHATATS